MVRPRCCGIDTSPWRARAAPSEALVNTSTSIVVPKNRKTPQRHAGGHRQRLIINRLALVGPEYRARRTGQPNNETKAQREIPLA